MNTNKINASIPTIEDLIAFVRKGGASVDAVKKQYAEYVSKVKEEAAELTDNEDDWMEVYLTTSFMEFCGKHTHLQPYRNFRYFQCWGGGPEGGYIHSLGTNTVFRVNRTWGEPFTVEPVDGTIEVHEDNTHIRIVPKH